MHRRQLFLMVVAIISITLGKEQNRFKRTLPFRNWISVIPPGSNAGVQPPPPPGTNLQWTASQRINSAYFKKPIQSALSILPNAKYPIYKIHKYNGFHIKPVLPQELKGKMLKPTNGPHSLETIKSILNTDISKEQIKSLVDLASNKDGMRVIMNLIDSGILHQDQHRRGPQPSSLYGPPEGFFSSSQFRLPQFRPQQLYGLPGPTDNLKYRPAPVGNNFQPIKYQKSISPRPPSTSYGFPETLLQSQDHAKLPSFKNILPFKSLPKLPSLPEPQLFDQNTHNNPFQDQKTVLYSIKTVQHIPVQEKTESDDSFSNKNPIVVTYESPYVETNGSEFYETVVDINGNPVHYNVKNIPQRRSYFSSNKVEKDATKT